ncbi:MAG: thymidylate kinase, partial [Clostridia bacterium]|nr:thymidylate kinase [Clostridia bacterium]
MIIDIEGTDGSGKATQTKMLFDYLTTKGKKCKIISFPNYESASSGPVKMYLNGDLGVNNSLTGYHTS